MQHEVTQHELRSGAKGLIVNVPGAQVTSLVVRFNSGFQFAPVGKYEIPHIMEHVLATSSQKYPEPNGFMIEAQRNGAYVNATTSSDTNGYVFECADFERDRIIDLLEEELVRPKFDEESFRAEVGNVREELSRNTTEYARVCNVRLAAAAYPGQSLDFTDRLDQLNSIALTDLEAHYRRTHTASNARFVVAGSLSDDSERILDRLERLFDGLPKGTRLERSTEIGLNLTKPVIKHEKIAQLYYSFDRYLGELSLDERAAAAVLRLVLTGGMGSLIFGEARRRGLAYGVNSGFGSDIGNSSFGFSGHVSHENAADLLELITRNWRDVAAGKLESSRVNDAKTYGLGSTRRSNQTVGDLLSWYVTPFNQSDIVIDLEEHLGRIESISRDGVVDIAAKFAQSKRCGMSLLGPVTMTEAVRFISLF
jgi:predicted Zn-dependent peptidase